MHLPISAEVSAGGVGSSVAELRARQGRRAREVMEMLLGFEAELEVLEHALPGCGTLLWPLARMRVFDGAVLDALGSVDPLPGRASRGVPGLPLLRYAAHVARHDPLRQAGRFELLMFGSSVGVSVEREGKWLGRINDHFALEYDARTLVLDQSSGRSFRWPRVPRHVAAHDALALRALLLARLRRPSGRPAGADEAAIERFLQWLRARLPVRPLPETMASVGRALRGFAARARFSRDAYLRLFERTEARMLFLEDASFTTQAYISKWARDFGLRTAEFQHGTITPSVSAYRYLEPLRSHAEFACYLPEFLLTYGEFWSENTSTPSQLVTIGNPHFELKRAELAGRARAAQAGRTLVFISQADAAPDLVPIAAELSARLAPGERLVYRLHPSESARAAHYAALHGLPNVRISDSGDVYELLHDADAVIGSSSTALFEAAGLGRPVYVFANPAAELYVPRSFASWFSSAGELHALLSRTQLAAIDPDHYFAPAWRPRFRAFVERTLR